MPSYLMRAESAYKWARKHKIPGISKITRGKYKGHYKIRTVSGNWKIVSATALVWHRGAGKWSEYTGVHDVRYIARTKIPRKKRTRMGNIGDAYKKI